MIISRSVHVASNGIISFWFFISENYSIVCVCVCVHARHILFICSSVEGHLDFPSVLPLVNSVAVNIGGYPGGSVVKNLPAMQETQV